MFKPTRLRQRVTACCNPCPRSPAVRPDNARTIEIEGRRPVRTLVFLEDSRHVLSGGEDGIIRQWRVEDGREVEDQRLTASGDVYAIAISGNGNWIVGGGMRVATVWNRKTRQIAHTVNGHTDWIYGADVSPDSTRFATGSVDRRVCIWDISTGRRLVGPLEHANWVLAVKFSPNGNHIATATWTQELRIYNAHNGQLLRNIAGPLYSTNPIAWSNDSQRIFSLSSNVIRHVYVDTGTMLSEWTIPGEATNFSSIALPRNGRFVASFTNRSLSFWDTSTHAQIGPVFDHAQGSGRLWSMALSSDNNHLATGSENGIITLRNLNDIIPLSYLVGQNVVQQPQTGIGAEVVRQIEALCNELRSLGSRLDELRQCINPQPSDRPQAQVTPLRISAGTYRIKSNTGDLCLAWLQDAHGTVLVQQSNQSSVSQRWTVSPASGTNGAYNIMGHSNAPLGVGIHNALVVGQSGTTWAFESRGDAFVVGNVANAMVIQLALDRQSVSVFSRNDSPNQRWVLEPVRN